MSVAAATTYQGRSLRVRPLEDGLVELVFDREGEAINKFDARTVAEMREATARIAADAAVRGVLVTSAKDVFIVGADITEFVADFAFPEAVLAARVAKANEVFDAFEDLPVPSVVALGGIALGGGLEMALAGAWRVMSAQAQVGLPEVRLGLFPGFGGTVRLPRLAGAAVAIDWVGGGEPSDARAALAAGVVDEVAAHGELRAAAIAALKRAVAGGVDWRARQQRKRDRLPSGSEALFAAALERFGHPGARHRPAAPEAIRLMAATATMDRRGALAAEHLAFARIARTQAADALVQGFLSEQAVRKRARQLARQGRPVRQVAVIGAGAVAESVALAAARAGAPVRRMDVPHVAGLDGVDLVIDAAAGGLDATRERLAALESQVSSDAVIAVATPALRIDDVAASLRRPHGLVGLHALDPGPLVEVARGRLSGDEAVATAVGHVLAMGRTPVVVKDGPGLLVGRLLAAFGHGLPRLAADGADIARVHRAMSDFGWPMPRGATVPPPAAGARAFSDAAIVERLMLPLIVEAALALEEGVAATPAELDQALLLGAGCPAHLGGALKYADWLGLPHVVERCAAHAHLGPAYAPTARMRAMAAQRQAYYPKAAS